VKYFAARYSNSRDFRAPDPRRFQHFQGNGVSCNRGAMLVPRSRFVLALKARAQAESRAPLKRPFLARDCRSEMRAKARWLAADFRPARIPSRDE